MKVSEYGKWVDQEEKVAKKETLGQRRDFERCEEQAVLCWDV
jgi:hypothetical protein